MPAFLVGVIAITVAGCENMAQMPPIVQINLAPSSGQRQRSIQPQPQYSSRMGSSQPRPMSGSGQMGDPYNRPYYEEDYSDNGFARSAFSQPRVIDPFGNTLDRYGRPVNRFGRCLSGNELMRFGQWWSQEQLKRRMLSGYPNGFMRGGSSYGYRSEPTCRKTRQPAPHRGHPQRKKRHQRHH